MGGLRARWADSWCEPVIASLSLTQEGDRPLPMGTHLPWSKSMKPIRLPAHCFVWAPSRHLYANSRADLGQIEVVQGRLPTSLQAVGIRPEAVTDLIFTHLHFDHIGWASAGGTAFFPNATVRCAAADLDHFLPGTPEDVYLSQVYRALTVAERLGPVLDRVETWESDGTILPGVDVRLAPGHTPGSSVMVISDRTERALILGDMVHCPLELMDDDFNLLVDYDQAMANAVREAYARELEGTNTPVVASHFPGLQFGRLLPSQGVRRWTFDAELTRMIRVGSNHARTEFRPGAGPAISGLLGEPPRGR